MTPLKKQAGNRRRGGGARLFVPVQGLALATLVVCLGIFSLNILHLHPKVGVGVTSPPQAKLPGDTAEPSTPSVEHKSKADDKKDEKPRKQQQPPCVRMNSVQDIQTCYPASFIRPFNEDSCVNEDGMAVVEDWSSVQRCLTGRRRFRDSETTTTTDDKQNNDPFVIHIVGERHSGTKFIMQQLQQCFLQPSAAPFVRKVHRDFIRVKHFFQPAIRGKDFRRHIVVVIVRNATDWVAAMHAKPYHSPSHVAGYHTSTTMTDKKMMKKSEPPEVVPLPWQDFVSRPWTTNRSLADEELQRQFRVDPKLRLRPLCQEMFAFHEVVPCQVDEVSYQHIPRQRRRGFAPLYEMRRHGSGQPFDHILQLRSDKIVNFCLQIPMWFNLGGFAIVRYEDLLQKGTRFFLDQMAEMVGMSNLPSECRPEAPQPERLGHRVIPEGLVQWVEDHIDADRERLLGYR